MQPSPSDDKERLAALGLLAAGIVHEIKNPLNFVNNFAALSGELVAELRELLAGATLTEAQRDDVEAVLVDLAENVTRIRQHGSRADRIVRMVLDQADRRGGDWREVDLRLLLEDAVALAYHGLRATRPELNADLRREFPDAPLLAVVLPGDLSRAVINLATNALQAMHPLTRQRGPTYRPVLVTRLRGSDGSAVIEINDNGPGIAEDMLPHLFEAFHSSKPALEGSGLGLAVVREIIEQRHGGTIEVRSTPGEGATFILRFPSRRS